MANTRCPALKARVLMQPASWNSCCSVRLHRMGAWGPKGGLRWGGEGWGGEGWLVGQQWKETIWPHSLGSHGHLAPPPLVRACAAGQPAPPCAACRSATHSQWGPAARERRGGPGCSRPRTHRLRGGGEAGNGGCCGRVPKQSCKPGMCCALRPCCPRCPVLLLGLQAAQSWCSTARRAGRVAARPGNASALPDRQDWRRWVRT